jgi:alpha-N-arabinofuranosidase
VNRGVGTGNLLGALAEAVFMLNMEKNSDVVSMCSYAPLFENVNGRDWPVNLILLDSSRTTGRSSYQVQKLFSANRPDFVFPTGVQAPLIALTNATVQQLYALAGLDEKRGEVVIKVVNPTPASVSAAINLQGASKHRLKGKVIQLGNINATAENSLAQPGVVVPVESDFKAAGPRFNYSFGPNSLTILRFPARVR